MEILIVDDNPDLRAILALIVQEAYGVEPQTFSDGDIALEYVKQLRPNSRAVLAFVDVQMPRVNGMTVVKALKSRCPSSLAVMLSANRAYRKSAYRAGADYFLSKPFELDELLGIIDDWSKPEHREVFVVAPPPPPPRLLPGHYLHEWPARIGTAIADA